MVKYIKNKYANIKTYIKYLPILLIISIFLGYILITSLSRILFTKVSKDYNKQADIYAAKLTDSLIANEKLDILLDEKLMNACKLVVSSQHNLNNGTLEIVAKNLNMDKIYWYNAQGQVIYTANDYMGWKASEGDNIHKFILSDDEFLVESIRPGLDSGVKYKYALLKGDNGEFVQVGILADTIFELTDVFCPKNFLENLMEKDEVVMAHFINNGNIIFCSQHTNENDYLLNQIEKDYIKSNRPYYTKKNISDIEYYEVLLPINHDGQMLGSLLIIFSLSEINRLTRFVSLIIILILLIIYYMVAKIIILKSKEVENIIEKEMKKAINENFSEFYLEYQPLLDLETNKIIGIETLARWNNKKLGQVRPDIFIKVAESSQLIIELGEWIIREACQFIKNLENRGLNEIIVAINISIVQLLQEDFVENLIKIASEEGVNFNQLQLEITESAFVENEEIINNELKILRIIGVTISIDDFGTGYSTLSRLKNLNIDLLKIDKSFVDNIKESEDEVFVRNIIHMAKELKLRTVAEGVETIEQKRYLNSKGCDIMQGYLLSRPILGDKMIELIYQTNDK